MIRIRYIGLLWLCCSAFIATTAQNKHAHSIQFQSINTIGLVEGATGTAFQFQTINGVKKGNWFAGAGIGVDYYKFRGLPLFIDLRRTFGNNGKRFFVYGDLGMHINWLTDNQKTNNGSFVGGSLKNGLYSDAGLGYTLSLGGKTSFLISAGWSTKSLSALLIDYTPQAYDGPPGVTKYQYHLNRLSLKMGLSF